MISVGRHSLQHCLCHGWEQGRRHRGAGTCLPVSPSFLLLPSSSGQNSSFVLFLSSWGQLGIMLGIRLINLCQSGVRSSSTLIRAINTSLPGRKSLKTTRPFQHRFNEGGGRWFGVLWSEWVWWLWPHRTEVSGEAPGVAA